ncbi:hypothetical protein SCB49_02479 [unidentified eubacterium SCB49]|nr:hypothetical protein SCB49_02479 [unidentified eubacterium SCB49]
MKKQLTIFTIILLCFIVKTNGQSVSCQELHDFIVEEGYQSSTVSSYTMNSSWLKKVTKYTYNYKNFVVAEIKKNEYSYQTNTYVFCGISDYNWSQFKYGGYGESDSYGERFHKYIFDYQCNCN